MEKNIRFYWNDVEYATKEICVKGIHFAEKI